MNLKIQKIPGMIVRFATSADTEGIIDLLKDSLGESTIPKSVELWNWKHQQSPFGPSYVMVAEEEGKIIGVRAFMQWKWMRDGIQYNAIRAVDTATHPQHQGKGIFKKLTLGLATECQNNGIHFIFNTPNEQSRPGYLKMGWEQAGKMPLRFSIKQPYNMLCSWLNKGKSKKQHIKSPTKWTSEIYEMAEKSMNFPLHLTTVLSKEYLSWRYGQNPLFDYHYMTDGENYLLIYRFKEHSFFDELRITDFILLNPKASGISVRKDIRKKLKALQRETCFSLMSISAQEFKQHHQYLSYLGFLPPLDLGPILTVKNLNMNELFPNLLKIKNWGFTLGDMELF